MTSSALRKSDYSGLNGGALSPSSNRPAITPKIARLIDEHNDLDLVISTLFEEGGHDDLLISRLKKRKLQIKDEISCVNAHLATQEITATVA